MLYRLALACMVMVRFLYKVKVHPLKELTDDEVAERDRRLGMMMLQKVMERAPGEVAEAQEKLLACLDYNPSYWSHQIAELAEKKMHAMLWARVARAAEAGSHPRGGVETMTFAKGDLISAVLAVRAEILDRLREIRPTSVSTSVVHNAMAAIELEAQLSWVRHLEYMVRLP